MRRMARLQHTKRNKRIRLVIFLSGCLLTGFLLIWVLIWLEQPLPGKNLSDQPAAIKPSPVPENTKDSFIFYEALEERNTDGSELMPLIPKSQEPIPSSPPTSSIQAVAPKGGKTYTVQVAAFSDQATAQALAGRLVKKGYKAYLNPQQVPGKGLWHQVRIGHYSEREEAETMAKRLLKNEQLTGFVAVETGSIIIR